MRDMTKFADDLVTLTVAELLELKKVLKDKYDLSINETVVVAQPTAETKPVIEEKNSFDVILIKVSEITSEKLAAVKIVKRITELGLQDSNAATKTLPFTLKKDVPKEDAEAIKGEFATVNAIIELK